MSNYTKSTNFATKDNLTPGDPLKVVRGTEIDTEFNNISTAIATKTDNSAAAITGGTIDGATVGATTPATGAFTTLAASGTTTLAGALVGAATQSAFNTVSTTLNLGGAATALNLGAATGTATVNNTTLAAKAITASTTLAVTGTSTLTGAVTATAGVSGPITSSSVSITGGSITGITDLAVADGGTGASTAAGGLNNLLPSQTGNSSKYLQTDGTNATWDAISINTGDITGTLPVANGGTGITSFGTGIATFLGTPSSANLASAVTDETGSGALVFANTPTLVAPILGTPTSGNFSSGSFTWPTFNQNTTGTAAGLSATLAIASGGTGQTTANAAFNALAPSQTSASGKYLKSDGTNTSWDALDISTADITGTLPVANGGTGVTSSTGTGSVVLSNSPTLVTPILGTPQSGNFSTGTFTWPTFNQNTTGTAAGLSATLATTSGGTGLTSFTSGGVVYASSTSALATGSALTFDGTNLSLIGVSTSPIIANIQNTNTNTSAGGRYQFSYGGVAVGWIANQFDGADFDNKYVASKHHIFYTGNTSPTEAMRITSSSLYTASGINVGFGTSSPQSLLALRTGGTSPVNGGVGLTISHNSNVIANGADLVFGGVTIQRDKSSALADGDSLGGINWGKLISGELRNSVAAIGALQSGTGESAHLTFYTAPSGRAPVERARIPAAGGFQSKTTISVGDATPSTSGAGITFPSGDTHYSSDANTLDDYEEGTWTPAGNGVTYTSPVGNYTKIGDFVFCTFNFTFPSTASASSAEIQGLPFAVSTSNGARGTISIAGVDTAISPIYGALTGSKVILRDTSNNDRTNVAFTTASLNGMIIYRV